MPVTLGIASQASPIRRTRRGGRSTLPLRLYADTSVVLASAAGKPEPISIAPGKTVTSTFTLPADPWPLGDKFVPLGLLVARANGRSWTREIALSPPTAKSAR